MQIVPTEVSPKSLAPARASVPVLVVDDNAAIHDDFRRILKRSHTDHTLDDLEQDLFGNDDGEVRARTDLRFDLATALQGRDALHMVRRALAAGRPYAVAFVDMRMPPGWDGLETVEHLWDAQPDLQVVICTAYSDHSWADIVRRLGSNDRLLILKKPFDSVEILQMAHALAKKWEMHVELEQRLRDLDRMVAERTRSLSEANERLRVEAENRERVETELRLAQKLQAMGQLAAGIAHEINTPVQYVSDNARFALESFTGVAAVVAAFDAALEAARTGPVPAERLAEVTRSKEACDLDYVLEDVPRALEQSLEGLDQVARIVGALKSFSHPGSAERGPVDVNESLRTTVTVARNEWKHVAEVELDLGDVPPVDGLAQELNQVWLNLVINSAHAVADREDHGNPKGVITLVSRAVGDEVEVRIGDTGCGIPKEAYGRIFDPFYTTKAVGRGTGQGLAIVHNVVTKKHSGSIAFESELGVGTTFIVRLPVAKHAH